MNVFLRDNRNPTPLYKIPFPSLISVWNSIMKDVFFYIYLEDEL